MTRILGGLTFLLRQRDALLIVVMMLVLLMMFLPLPSVLMDMLQAINIGISIIILLMAMQMHSAIQFSTFPAVLLVTTLYRLGLSIASTRLILLEADAGEIVQTFGEVVIGGNLVVGMVIFLIITIVQFIVITKGADRVAEVGARFTLDGMPGKQMSVDADVRAGNINKFDAKAARLDLEREAKLFGAMDGAMKFVKGDAVASLIITAVNLLGGIAIGMTQMGLPFSEALTIYSVLTIGDGLVGQIPALMISVAAGTMVTRVTGPEGVDLGTEIAKEMTSSNKTVIYSGLAIASFGFVPGFPTLIFLALGGAMSGGLVLARRRADRLERETLATWPGLKAANDNLCSAAELRTGVPSSVRIELPTSISVHDAGHFFKLLSDANSATDRDFGVSTGLWRFDYHDSPDGDYRIRIQGDVLSSGRVRPDQVFVKANASYLAALQIPHVVHFGVEEGAIVHVSQCERLQAERISYWDAVDLVIMDVKRTIAANLDLFVGFQATSTMLDELAKTNPGLAGDLRDNLSINQIGSVLRMLVQERIPMNSRVRIFEAILGSAPKNPDPLHVLQNVRLAIGDLLTQRFAPDGFLPCMILSPTLESFIREGFRNANDETFLIIDTELTQSILAQCKAFSKDPYKRGRDPVILTQQDIRRAVHNLLHAHGFYLPVLAYQELTPQTVIYPVGFINPGELSAAA